MQVLDGKVCQHSFSESTSYSIDGDKYGVARLEDTWREGAYGAVTRRSTSRPRPEKLSVMATDFDS